jgi:MATE family multidrug resistance protein
MEKLYMASNTGYSHKIWHLAWPMIISNLSVPLIGLVDTAILGHLENAHYLAAVAVGSSILSFLYWGFGFLRMGTTGLAAQAFGARQHDQNRQILGQSIILGCATGLIIIVLSPLLLKLGFYLIAPPAGAEALASRYASIRVFSAPAVLINYAIIGWLIGQQNTRWPLLITLFTSLLNVFFDCLLVIGLDMKSEGAAIATLIAEYGGCGLALVALKQTLKKIPGTLDTRPLYQWRNYYQLINLNSHLFIRTFVLLGCLSFFTAQGATYGGSLLAANTILMNLLLLASFGLDGFAHAAEALTGDAIGKRQASTFNQVCLSCAKWSLITAGLFSLFFALLGEQLIAAMTSLPSVQTEAKTYLPWLIALPLVSVWSYLLDGIFIGATQTRAMRNTMLLSAVLIYLPCWLLTQQWQNHGLWFAFICFNAARGISLGWLFFRYQQQRLWWLPVN